jgi:hypothetical protein
MFIYTHPRVQEFSAFIEKERSSCEADAGNSLSFALGSLLRKYQKIWLLRERALPLVARYGEELASQVTWESGPVSDEQQRQIAEASNLIVDIELHFESFFMYGAILCDDVAQLLLYLYGSARQIKLGGHRELSKNFGAFAETLSLDHNKEFPKLAAFLETELCDYRDKQIVHDFHPRKMDSVSFSNDKRDVQMMYGMLYPKGTDTYVISKTWGELLEALDKYIWLTLEMVRANRERSRFRVNKQR